jgi:hypothetical protein
MSYRPVAVALLAGAALGAQAAPALADRSNCASSLERTYSAHYYAVAKKFNRRAPGRNIRKYGVQKHDKVRNATCHELRVSRGQLIRLRRPPRPGPPLLVVKATSPQQAPAGVSSATPKANLPDCTWRPESGGDYGAYNPSGARGKYQIMPSTHAAYCSELGWSPGEQDTCAARIYAGQGAGAWVNCG